MGNTLENKAKFFAIYWGQRVMRCKTFNVTTGYGLSGLMNVDVNSETIKENWFLELKPLSSISDEDAEYCIGKVECNIRKNDPNHGDYGMSPSAIFVNSIIGDSSYHIGKREADYLRSKGYALKWMDKNIKEQLSDGWIKLNGY